MKPETRQEIAQRLGVEAEELVARQQALIAHLALRGYPTVEALTLLVHFEKALANFRRTLVVFQAPEPETDPQTRSDRGTN
jgi:hypothetical protein